MTKDKDQQPITSQAAAAAYCGVTIRTIRNKEKDYPLKDGRGNYIPEMLDRYVRPATADKKSGSLKEKTLFADLDLKDKKSKLAQWELDLRAGKYKLAEEADRENISKIIEVRRALLALPRKLSAKLENKTHQQIQIILTDEMAYCLDVFAGKKTHPPADPVIETLEYYYLLSPMQRREFKGYIGCRNSKKKNNLDSGNQKNLKSQISKNQRIKEDNSYETAEKTEDQKNQ